MSNTIKKLQKLWLLASIIGFIMLIISPWFYRIWIGNEVNVSFMLSLVMFILIMSRTLGGIYMYLINGIGTIKVQLFTYIIFAIISWPCLVVSCRLLGLPGITIIPIIVYIVQAFIAKYQLNLIINNNAKGIWAK